MKKHLITSTLFVVLLVGASTSSFAYDPDYGMIVDLLHSIRTEHPRIKYERSTGSNMSYMNQGEYESYIVELPSAGSFEIVAVCDRDCDDISLDVYDSSKTKIAMNRSKTDFPIVRFDINDPFDTTVKVHVNMNRCHKNPCEYGIEIYQQN